MLTTTNSPPIPAFRDCATGADAIKRLYKKFGMWHGISSLCNLSVLVAAVAHGWWLAGALALA